jgi:flagellar hook assembly protein FlgD
VQIYTQDGALVRTFRKDDNTQTYLDWNLKNNAGVPIASGVYYIHVKATDLGEERIIKWFGVMRPVDFDTF